MITNVVSIAKSKKDKVYATDAAGNAYFPQTPTVAAALKAGCYVNFTSRLRTQTLNDKGVLVDLDAPVNENIITGVFSDRSAAIAFKAEPEMFEMEAKAYAHSQRSVLAKKYELTPEALAATI